MHFVHPQLNVRGVEAKPIIYHKVFTMRHSLIHNYLNIMICKQVFSLTALLIRGRL